jgi:hypothetical protein
MASEAALKGSVGEAAKDAYEALREKISDWAANDVTALELNPTSAARRAIIAETVNTLPTHQQEAMRALAIELATTLKANAEQRPVGIDVGALEAARIHLEGISVTHGVGIRAQSIKTPGDFDLKNLNVGEPAGKVSQ